MILDTRNDTDAIRIMKTSYMIGALLIIYLACGIALILVVHTNTVPFLSTTWLLRAHAMCAGFGMIGSCLAAIRKYYRALITDSANRGNQMVPQNLAWDFGWAYYYMTRPILGAVLGALAFTLSFVGFQALAKPSEIEMSDHGRYLLFGLAFVAGFSVSHVLDRLNTIAKQVFKVESPTNENQP